MTRNTLLSVFALLLFMVTSPSCEKTYEDGPRFSLRSKKARITRTWKISKKYRSEEGDMVFSINDSLIRYSFENDGHLEVERVPCNPFNSFDLELFTGAGHWEFREGFYGDNDVSMKEKEGLYIKLDNGYKAHFKIFRLLHNHLIVSGQWTNFSTGFESDYITYELVPADT